MCEILREKIWLTALENKNSFVVNQKKT